MPRRQIRHVEKPWIRDPAILRRWQELMDQGRGGGKTPPPIKPDKGWQLWRLDTLEDVPQE